MRAGDHRFRENAIIVRKSVAAFGGPVKPHKAKNAPGGLAVNKQPKEDRRPNSMSTIERKRGMEGIALKLPKLPSGRNRAESDISSNNKPFSDQPAGNAMMALLNKKGGGPIKIAYDAEDGVEVGRIARRQHSPVLTNSGGELQGESEYIAVKGEISDRGGDDLERLLQQAKNAKVAPRPHVSNKNLQNGKGKKGAPSRR